MRWMNSGLLEGGAFLFGGEGFVQRTGGKAFQVEADEFEAEGAELFDDLRAERLGSEFRYLAGGNFNSGDVAVMADTEFDKAKRSQEILSLLDLCETVAGDLQSIGKPRGKTRAGWHVGGFETELPAEVTNILLRKSSLGQRRADAEVLHGAVAGAEVVEIVEVGAKDDVLETFPGGDIEKFLTEVGFAVEASVGAVGGEIGVLKLVSIDAQQAHAEGAGKSARALEHVFGFHGTRAYAGKDIGGAEGIDGSFKEECAIDTAGIGYDHLAQRGEDAFEGIILLFDVHKADGGI